MISPCAFCQSFGNKRLLCLVCASFSLTYLHQVLPFIHIQHGPYSLGNAAVGSNTFLAVLIERLLHWQARPRVVRQKGLVAMSILRDGLPGVKAGMERVWNGYGTRYGTKSPIFCQVKKTLTGSICRRSAYRQADGGKRSQQSSSSLETSHQSSSPLTDPTAVTPI